MPKIPRSSTRSDGQKRPKSANGRSKSGSGNGAKRPKAARKPKPAKGGKTTKTAKGATAVEEKEREQGVQRQQVDEAPAHAPAGPSTQLTKDQRVLLGDLFAVIEEHAADAVEQVDRDK